MSGENGGINFWWGGGGRGIYWGIFPGGRMSKFSAGGKGLPPSFPVGKLINIDTIVPGCVLIPLANHNSRIFSVPRGTEKLNKLPQAQKKPW